MMYSILKGCVILGAVLLITTTPCYAQVPAPTVELSKLYGGTKGDYPTSIIQTKDRGYLIGGWTMSKDGDVVGAHGAGNMTDGWVVKTDSNGTLLWARAIGGTNYDDVHTVAEGENLYVVGGRAWSYDGDLSGSTGPMSRGFIAWLNKVDGSIISIKTYAGTQLGQIEDIKVMENNNLLVTGMKFTAPLSNGTLWVSLMDSSGNAIWDKNYGRANVMSGAEHGFSSIRDGNYYMVAGKTSSSDGDAVGQHGGPADGFVLRLDSAGNKIWSKCYGGNGEEYFMHISQSTNGYILTGNSLSPDDGDISGQHGMSDYWALKIDTAGNVLWSKVFGGTGEERMVGSSGTCDGGVIISGSANSNDGDVTIAQGMKDFFLVRLSSDGDVEWKQCYGSSVGESYCVVTTTRDSGYALSGLVGGTDGDIGGLVGQGQGDIWLGKLSSDGLNTTCPEAIVPQEPAKISMTNKGEKIHIYPNPATSDLTIENTRGNRGFITDISGRVLQTFQLNSSGKTTISIASYTTGMYYLHFEDMNVGSVQKFSVIK